MKTFGTAAFLPVEHWPRLNYSFSVRGALCMGPAESLSPQPRSCASWFSPGPCARRQTGERARRLRPQTPGRRTRRPRQPRPAPRRPPERPTNWTSPPRPCGSIRRSTCSRAPKFSSPPPARPRIPPPIRRGRRKRNPSAPRVLPEDGGTWSVSIRWQIPDTARSSGAWDQATVRSRSPSARTRSRTFPCQAGFFWASIRG